MTDNTKTEKPLTCCICGGDIEVRGTWRHGNNAQPVADGRCCTECDNTVVIPLRIDLIREARISELAQSRKRRGR
jgi:hypothetical protein